jgi:hypothetical protein
LSATSSTSDEYHLVAQTLLATAFFPIARASLYDQTLDVATPAYRRVGTAVIDLWFDAVFDALPASEWCVIKPLLESCVELILTHCQNEGSSPDEWMKTSWLISESLRV